MTVPYNPDNLFAVKCWEVELRKTAKRTLIARFYQPQGTGPFPVRLSEEAPYPACVQDAHYAIRWLKHKARELNGDITHFGILGSSSGGHVAQLIGMKPHDPKYAAIPLPEALHLDATAVYIATRSPISNPVARRAQAEKNPPRLGGTKSWISLLPAEHVEELTELRRSWRAGEFQASGRELAYLIIQQCAERGIPTCGPEGVRAWLASRG